MKRCFLLLAFITLNLISYAQKGSIKGKLTDSADHQRTLSYSTVSIYKKGDSTLTSYGLSDDKGIFKINSLQTNQAYRLVITAWQYQSYRREFTITGNTPDLDLGSISLASQTNNLDEVVVTAEIPPIIVRKDTIEFNAASFKTLPSAVVEDLLKKLPGVTYDRNGSLKVNGKDVSKILVDGKEFFGGDQQVATKNLPANIIDKVQVTDDKEAKRRDPDLIAANTPQVINLKLKKAIKKGAFGKLYAGGGPRELYETGGIMNFFRDTTQVSVLAYSNNLNRPGFSVNDVQRIGGFGRSGINSMMVNSDGGFSLNNISFGGTAAGVQESSGGGANFNTITKSGIKINGQYFFGKVDNNLLQLVNNNQTLGQERLITASDLNANNIDLTHNFGGKLEWKPDSLTTITIEPRLTLSSANRVSQNSKRSINGDDQLVNEANTRSNINGDNDNIDVLLSYWKDFKKAGRSFNASLNFQNSNNSNENINTASSAFYLPPSNELLDQLRDNSIENLNTNVSLNYTEPISKALSFNAVLNGNYIESEDALSTFYRHPTDDNYIIAIPSLSQTVSRTGFKGSARARLRWKVNEHLSIQPALVFNTINLRNGFSSYPGFRQNYNFIAPALNVRYKILSLDYTPSFQEPAVSYIQPVSNNTDPLYIQNGNASLLPATTHRVYLNLYKYDSKNTLSYNLYGYGSLQKNAVIMSREISSSGVQISTPVNASGIYEASNGANINKDIKRESNIFKVGLGYWATFNRQYVIVNSIKSRANIFNIQPYGDVGIILNDVLELNQSVGLQVNRSLYDDPFFRDINFTSPNSETELVLRFPKKIVWESTYSYSKNARDIAGYNNSIKLWRAAVTFLFLKNDRAQLKLAVNDILQNGVRRYVTITQNAIIDTQSNNIGRYGTLTFTYNIQNFGAKVGGRQRFFGF